MNFELAKRIIETMATQMFFAMRQAPVVVGDEDQYDSPLEFSMATAMYLVLRLRFQGMEFFNHFGATDAECFQMLKGEHEIQIPKYRRSHAMVFPHVRIDPYRVDFFAAYERGEGGPTGGVVIECDGHEFHEKTKEQVAHDKVRDRYLQSKGYKVLRFAGSELWKDPLGCAEQALEDIFIEIGLKLLSETEGMEITA